MKPGATTSPAASIRVAAVAAVKSPIAAMRSPLMPTSARNHGAPVPSTIAAAGDEDVEVGRLPAEQGDGEARRRNATGRGLEDAHGSGWRQNQSMGDGY